MRPLPCLWAMLMVAVVTAAVASDRPAVRPYEQDSWSIPQTALDQHVLAALQARQITPARPCSDEVFLRRVYLDVIGTLPEPEAVVAFKQDSSPGKREALIRSVMEREEFADYWALKWCDLLRVKSEFPINLWPNAVQAYHRWVRDAIAQNKPYDQYVRELLTATGSNFRDPAANFYRAVQGRDPASLAAAVSLTFMGVRWESWPPERRAQMAAFFSRVAYKKTTEWKEEIVYLNPAAAQPLEAVLPDGTPVHIGGDEDPRRVFADWLVRPQNPWFSRNIVNRIWSWLMGRGIIHEPDDIRPDNPPVNPELLTYLEQELVTARFDLRHIYRLILNSRTYQQSCIPRSTDPAADELFAHYPVRRLDAEVLADALSWLTGKAEEYSSPIPEPFTFIPESNRTITLADGSISSPFLELFGRPARDTGLESERSNQPSDAQRLHLINSSELQRSLERSPRLAQILNSSRFQPALLVRNLYLTILSREPTGPELNAAVAYCRTMGWKLKQAAVDLAWALINTKEFLYRH